MKKQLRHLWRLTRQNCPAFLMPTLRSIYNAGVSVQCAYLAVAERDFIRNCGFASLPPPRMRHTISGGKADAVNFLEVGQGVTQMIAENLASVGVPLADCERVLDFGCGCGRLLLWMTKLYPHCKFYGTDIDAGAVSWCQRNLPDAICAVNQPAPPLNYPSDFFDVVYATSVFTHLTEEHQFQYLGELQRILKPGGVAFLSLLGPEASRSMLSDGQLAVVNQKGIFATNQTVCTLSDRFPDSYTNTFVTEEYVRSHYTTYFDIVKYLRGGHDVVLLRKRERTHSSDSSRDSERLAHKVI